jgi:ribonuclease T2
VNVTYAGFLHSFERTARTAAVTFSFLFLFAVVAFAQGWEERPQNGRGQNEPGRFDFYVLALSWSPSFCAAAAERSPNRSPDQQCGGRPFSFVVHGLWPQHEQGFPSNCQVPSPRLNRGIVGANLDLMPSPRLIFHEWDRHGTCSGLSASSYFDSIRKARQGVTIPPEYTDLDKPMMVSPGDVSAAFIKANPGLSKNGLAVACDSRWLSEVRICLNKDLSFRDCPELARRTCRRDRVAMPAVRGG